jgi:hypothetical protein
MARRDQDRLPLRVSGPAPPTRPGPAPRLRSHPPGHVLDGFRALAPVLVQALRIQARAAACRLTSVRIERSAPRRGLLGDGQRAQKSALFWAIALVGEIACASAVRCQSGPRGSHGPARGAGVTSGAAHGHTGLAAHALSLRLQVRAASRVECDSEKGAARVSGAAYGRLRAGSGPGPETRSSLS